ncbi:MAG: hypothetical protein AAF480_07520 [Actinomycetota bacterium]
MTLKRVLDFAHLLFAGLYLVFVLFGKWAKGEPDEGVFSADGGAGFGIIAVVLGIALVVLALMRIIGRTQVLPGLGVEQLTVALGLAATLNLIGFIVGWLAIEPFSAGTGWGVVAAYFPASFIPQVGLLTLSATEPDTGVKPLGDGQRRTLSLVAVLAGAGVALFPYLTWMSSGPVSLAGFDEGAGDNISGPRLAYILLVVGAVVFIAGLMRLRPEGLTEPGPNLLLSHALFGVGMVAFVLPLSTLITVFQTDGLDPGIGLWLGLLAGLVMLVVAVAENRQRGSAGA